jgi:hypothetical protein
VASNPASTNRRSLVSYNLSAGTLTAATTPAHNLLDETQTVFFRLRIAIFLLVAQQALRFIQLSDDQQPTTLENTS